MAEKLYFETKDLDIVASTDPTAAIESQVKSNLLYRDKETKDLKTGTMPINPAELIKINPEVEGSTDFLYRIPAGYHDGNGKVYTGKLRDYTPGTATADDIITSKTAWVNGQKVIGTLNVEQAEQVGTATADDIAEGKIAWVNKQKITGNLPQLPRMDKTILAGETYTVPRGVSGGFTKISGASLSSQTVGNASSSDISSGKTAWVNGQKVTGTLNINKEIEERLAATNARQSQVLSGKKFYASDYGQVVSGTMPNHSSEPVRIIDIGQTYIIPEGYYDGISAVKTKALRDVTVGTAVPDNILVAKTAWVNGSKVTGTMPYNDPVLIEIDAGTSFNVPEGYHTGSGIIKAKSIERQTEGTATTEDILLTKTAWVNGEKLTGTMPNYPPTPVEIHPGDTYYVPAGHHSGSGAVWVKELSEYTEATADETDIIKDKTAWVNGEKLTGTLALTATATENDVIAGTTFYSTDPKEKLIGTLTINGTALAANVLSGFTFFNTDIKNAVNGSMPNNGKMEVIAEPGRSYTIPLGYHNGQGYIQVPSIEDLTPGTATSADIIKDKTAWVNGEKITGNMLLDGNATADKVLEGFTFFAQDPQVKITGTMGSVPKETVTLLAGETYTVPIGYHAESSTVTAETLATQTQANATSNDMLSGKTAWVNGEKISGNMVLDGNATADTVLANYTFFAQDPMDKLTGTIPTRNINKLRITAGNIVQLPAGYYSEGVEVYALYDPTEILDLTGTNAWYDAPTSSLHPEDAGYIDEAEPDTLVIRNEN